MPAAAVIWVWTCAYLNAAGWALSALHQLNARGYAVVLAVWCLALFLWRKKTSPQILPQIRWQKIYRRFHKPFPLAFLILAAMAFLGGAIYPPNNYDALAYRLPRILHWLSAGHWHWIHTTFERVNTRGCGIEWVSAPIIALAKTDRWLFLLNTAAFLLLPGLAFSFWTRLGVRRRVAWRWMWLFASAYGFLLQSGSLGNDLFGAVFVLAAMHFALRARETQSPRDFFSAIVAAGMMTACKLSNIALLLPWGIALLPSLKLLFRWPARLAAVCALAVTASFLPTAVANYRHYNDWTGLAAEEPGMVKAPVFKTCANAAQALLQNFVPPVFPLADKWDRLMDQKLPAKLIARVDQTMEAEKCRFYVEQMQIEENAGLGFGLSVLLVASIAAAALSRRKISGGGSWWLAAVRWSPFVCLLALFAQSNLFPVARVLSPYYALLLAPLLGCAGHEQVIRKKWWRAAAFGVFLLAAAPLILSPARPLFPVQTVLAKLRHPPERVATVYSVYGARNDAFAPARAALPPGLKVLGLVTYDDPETSLWRPFGSRRIVHVCPADTAAELKVAGVEFILVKPDLFQIWFHRSFDDWLKNVKGEIVQSIPLHLRAGMESGDWQLVRLQ
jgi:hypothetical protein